MKTPMSIALALISLTGCQVAQKKGTELTVDTNDRWKTFTFVSPEDYHHMTPQERERLHARMGFQATYRLGEGSRPSQSKPISSDDLDKAMEAAKQNSSEK